MIVRTIENYIVQRIGNTEVSELIIIFKFNMMFEITEISISLNKAMIAI